MASKFLIYGATGYVGRAVVQRALDAGLKPIIAGRNAQKVKALADSLGVEWAAFAVDDSQAMDKALGDVSLVLNCAGPFRYTAAQMAAGCLRAGAHYLDITGEIPVFEMLHALDDEARTRGVMIMPGVGFDVVPTDCLAVHLKQRLPSATRLTLAFSTVGPAKLPPGTAKTAVGSLPSGIKIRTDGKLAPATPAFKKQAFDFGQGAVEAVRLTWGDLYTAYYSTGIPNIEVYSALGKSLVRMMPLGMRLAPLLKWRVLRSLALMMIQTGSTAEELAQSRAHVWGEVEDEQGRRAAARLHGPEAGVVWTSMAAVGAARKVLEGVVKLGFQTPAQVFGPDFVLEQEGVSREDMDVD